ncbi:hypothetical protein NBRC116594_01910 [Shimia sp. NS0008-38b]
MPATFAHRKFQRRTSTFAIDISNPPFNGACFARCERFEDLIKPILTRGRMSKVGLHPLT